MGFAADIQNKTDRKKGEMMRDVQAEDLLHFGLIPEFIGRLPVVATLEELDEEALIAILTEPKNALVKQYQRLFELDGVKLTFTDESLRAIANLSVERKTGARGLRAIMEDSMLDIMYEIPSLNTIKEVVISEEVIRGEAEPITVLDAGSEAATA